MKCKCTYTEKSLKYWVETLVRICSTTGHIHHQRMNLFPSQPEGNRIRKTFTYNLCHNIQSMIHIQSKLVVRMERVFSCEISVKYCVLCRKITFCNMQNCVPDRSLFFAAYTSLITNPSINIYTYPNPLLVYHDRLEHETGLTCKIVIVPLSNLLVTLIIRCTFSMKCGHACWMFRHLWNTSLIHFRFQRPIDMLW